MAFTPVNIGRFPVSVPHLCSDNSFWRSFNPFYPDTNRLWYKIILNFNIYRGQVPLGLTFWCKSHFTAQFDWPDFSSIMQSVSSWNDNQRCHWFIIVVFIQGFHRVSEVVHNTHPINVFQTDIYWGSYKSFNISVKRIALFVSAQERVASSPGGYEWSQLYSSQHRDSVYGYRLSTEQTPPVHHRMLFHWLLMAKRHIKREEGRQGSCLPPLFSSTQVSLQNDWRMLRVWI